MSVQAEQLFHGKIECPDCGHRTCQVFHDGGMHCFHPGCDFHFAKMNSRGEPLLPPRKKPKKSSKALKNFHKLNPADPRHRYFRSHCHRGDLALQIEGLDFRQDGDWLAIGMYNSDGVLRNIQYIGLDGKKRFLKGYSTRGLFFRIGNAGTAKVGLAEGIATGVSFHQATGLDTYVSFGCNNLAAVANHISSTGKKVIVCSDFGVHSQAIAEEVAAGV